MLSNKYIYIYTYYVIQKYHSHYIDTMNTSNFLFAFKQETNALTQLEAAIVSAESRREEEQRLLDKERSSIQAFINTEKDGTTKCDNQQVEQNTATPESNSTGSGHDTSKGDTPTTIQSASVPAQGVSKIGV